MATPEVERLVEYAARVSDEAEDLRRQYEKARRTVRRAILEAYEAGGSPTKMAETLGIHRVHLYKLLDQAERDREQE